MLNKEINYFNKLSEKDRELCNIRLNNPEKTLAELGELMNPPLSKSGVNHRLTNIHKIAEEIKQEEG